jgi:hypothetical protein
VPTVHWYRHHIHKHSAARCQLSTGTDTIFTSTVLEVLTVHWYRHHIHKHSATRCQLSTGTDTIFRSTVLRGANCPLVKTPYWQAQFYEVPIDHRYRHHIHKHSAARCQLSTGTDTIFTSTVLRGANCPLVQTPYSQTLCYQVPSLHSTTKHYCSERSPRCLNPTDRNLQLGIRRSIKWLVLRAFNNTLSTTDTIHCLTTMPGR